MLNSNPVAAVILFVLAVALAGCASVYGNRPRPTRGYPREPWFERLGFWSVVKWDVYPNASAWAAAIARAGEWAHNAFTNHKLVDELEEVHGRLGRLLCEASGGKASKTNYSSETMSGLVQEFQEDMVNDRLVDALADLPNFEFPWARIRVLCQHFEVSEGEVSERRRQKRDMEKLVASTRRERERAAKSGKRKELAVSYGKTN